MSAELELAAEAPVTLFRTDDPGEVIARATETANALATVIRSQKLAVTISGREHVRVEGWTMLGSLLGVFPVCVWTRYVALDTVLERGEGWEARVEARTRAGEIVGAAEAECLRSEKLWANRDDYALRSMAQTRATSKALRLPLGFVMTLAGFEATPAEEMPAERGVAETGVTGSAEKSSDGEPVPPAEKATAAQVKKCHTLVDKLQKADIFDGVQYAALLRARYGTSHFSELSRSQASAVIDELEAMERDAAIPF